MNDFKSRQPDLPREELPVNSADSEELGEALDSVAEIPSLEAVRRQVTRTRSTVISPVSMEWKNVGCTYRTGNTSKVVLEGTRQIHHLIPTYVYLR